MTLLPSPGWLTLVAFVIMILVRTVQFYTLSVVDLPVSADTAVGTRSSRILTNSKQPRLELRPISWPRWRNGRPD